MKIYCEVDMSYLEGDAGRDLEDKVVENLVERIRADLGERIEKKTANLIDREMNIFVTQILTDFIDKSVSLTDCYGHTKEKFDSLEDLIKARLETFMTEKVDTSGKTYTGCSYGDKLSRTQFLIDGRINKVIEEYFAKLTKKIMKSIEQKIEQEKENAVEKAIADNLDIKALIGSVIAEKGEA